MAAQIINIKDEENFEERYKALDLPLGFVGGILLFSLLDPKVYFGQPIVDSPILVGSIFIGLWTVRFVYCFYFKKSSEQNKEQNDSVDIN